MYVLPTNLHQHKNVILFCVSNYVLCMLYTGSHTSTKASVCVYWRCYITPSTLVLLSHFQYRHEESWSYLPPHLFLAVFRCTAVLNSSGRRHQSTLLANPPIWHRVRRWPLSASSQPPSLCTARSPTEVTQPQSPARSLYENFSVSRNNFKLNVSPTDTTTP